MLYFHVSSSQRALIPKAEKPKQKPAAMSAPPPRWLALTQKMTLRGLSTEELLKKLMEEGIDVSDDEAQRFRGKSGVILCFYKNYNV